MGSQLDKIGQYLKGLLTDPIMKRLDSMDAGVVGARVERLERDVVEIRKVLEEIMRSVKDKVEKVEKVGMEKEGRRQKRKVRDRGVNVGVSELRGIIAKTMGLTGKKGLRARIGCVILYLTGMRIGSLRGLDTNWFRKNVLENADGEISYIPNKQRGGERKEL